MSDQPKVTAPIDTLEYQARVSAEHRPCGATMHCDAEWPTQPWRWCSGCIIAALLNKLEADPKVTAESPRQLEREIEIAKAESHAPATYEQLEHFISERMRLAYQLGAA